MRNWSLMAAWCVSLSCASMALGQPVQPAQPTDPTSTAIFAGRNITFNGFDTVAGGAVVANGNVSHNGGQLDVPSIYAGGTFSRSGAAFQNIYGDMLFGGNITDIGGPGSLLGGNVYCGGSLSFLNSSVTVSGNVTAAGSVSQPFSFAAVNGNLTAGGDVNIQGTVGGNVTYGGALTQGTFSHIGGALVHGGAVTVPAYVPLTLPAGRTLTAGTTDITLAHFENRSIAPGVYGTLNYATGNTVTLTAGQYVFANIVSSFALNKLAFDTSAGPINVYLPGNLDFNVVQVINGEPLFAGGNPHPADSQNIFVEVGGSYIGDASIYGTVFAPNGDITLNTFSDVTGKVLAGRDVVINSGGVTVVPEPGTLGIFAALGAAFLRRRRKQPGA